MGAKQKDLEQLSGLSLVAPKSGRCKNWARPHAKVKYLFLKNFKP
jgi:ribosome biogenesis protein Nip4